jgi:hypothetical protein
MQGAKSHRHACVQGETMGLPGQDVRRVEMRRSPNECLDNINPTCDLVAENV